MPIIPNQPIALKAPAPDCPCPVPEKFNQVYFNDDPLNLQIKADLTGEDLFAEYNFIGGSGWDSTYYGYCHNTGSSGSLFVSEIEGEKNYQVTVTVTSYNGGTITVMLGTNVIGYIESDGDYVFDGKSSAGATTVALYADDEFEGCVTEVVIYAYCSDYQLKVYAKNPAGEFVFYDTLQPDSQFGDHVFFKEVFSEVFEVDTEYCFYMCLYGCDLLFNGDFDDEYDGWGIEAGWSSADPGKGFYNGTLDGSIFQTLEVEEGHTYIITLTVSEFTDPVTLDVILGDNTFQITNDGTYTTEYIHSGDSIFTLTGTGTGSFKVDDISVRELQGCTDNILYKKPVDEESIQYCETHLLKWRGEEDAFGFDYTTDLTYYHALRVKSEFMLSKTRYTDDASDYIDAEGTALLTAAILRKIRTLVVDEVNEDIHDALWVMRRHDEILVDGIQYVSPVGTEFAPAYSESTQLAPVEIPLADPTQDLSNSFC